MDDTSVLDHYLAPLRPFLAPDDVTEVVVNRPGEVGVEQAGGWCWHDAPVLTEPWLRTLAVAAAAYTKQDVDAERPICSTVPEAENADERREPGGAYPPSNAPSLLRGKFSHKYPYVGD